MARKWQTVGKWTRCLDEGDGSWTAWAPELGILPHRSPFHANKNEVLPDREDRVHLITWFPFWEVRDENDSPDGWEAWTPKPNSDEAQRYIIYND